jgi:hypothetical protein
MSDSLAAALSEALELLIRRLVQEEVRRAEHEWRWLTPEQAGELLGISPAAVRQRVVRGQLPAKKLEGRVYLDIHDSRCRDHERPLRCPPATHHRQVGRAVR